MISCENLVKIYKTEQTEVLALQGLDISINEGEIIALIGASGSGKSTFLNILGALDKQSAGNITVAGIDISKMNEKETLDYKRNIVSFVWQNSARNLLPYLSVIDNIVLPMEIIGKKADRQFAQKLLDIVGIGDKTHSKLFALSGGEQQRVAIAMALANNPKILLADEPTGAVDNNTANLILDLFRKINKELGVTVIIVTHDLKLSAKVDRVIKIKDGRISTEYLKLDKNTTDLVFEHKDTEKEQTHQEYVFVDRVGRMQIPQELLEKAHIEPMSRIKIEFDKDGRIVLIPN
ncbi:MAG: ATP-binding cassette domain-containing protein [Clostridiales bacterium]|nr:ATP-binding cassette domain-containing protein [Clostridiales bacterium]